MKSESPASSKKAENLRGCDLLQELSVTIRRFKKTSIAKERSDLCFYGASYSLNSAVSWATKVKE